MYFHRILASAITSDVFVGLFNFIITTAMANEPKMKPVPVCRITGHAHLILSQRQHGTEAFGFSKPKFQQKYLILGFTV